MAIREKEKMGSIWVYRMGRKRIDEIYNPKISKNEKSKSWNKKTIP